MNLVSETSNGAQPHRILILCAEPAKLRPFMDALADERWDTVIEANPRRGLLAIRDHQPDLILIEDGPDTIAHIYTMNSSVAAGEFLPIIVFSTESPGEPGHGATSAPLNVFFQDARQTDQLSRLVRQLYNARRTSLQQSLRAETQVRRSQEMEIALVQRLSHLSELKDHPESGHVFRVGSLSARMAQVLGLGAADVRTLLHAAPLHDVGNLCIADAILDKDGLLTLEEMDIVKTHTALGARLVSDSSSPILQVAEVIALFHHENWDGTGYTPGMEGESIPLPARIVRVADTYDAIRQPRSFADQMRNDEALDFIRSHSGRHFDPAVVEAFMEVQDRSREPESATFRGGEVA
jgi:cyclic di-GMP phosphodiesterase